MVMVDLERYALNGKDGQFSKLVGHPLVRATILKGESISGVVRRDKDVLVILDGYPLEFSSDDDDELNTLFIFFHNISMRFKIT